MFIRFICWLLKHKRLSLEDRQLLTNVALSTIGSLPLHATIAVDDENKLLINGRPLEMEAAIRLRASAGQVLNSFAFKVIHEQAIYLGVSKALHQSTSDLENYFGKAAVWFGQQETELLRMLAGSQGNQELPLSEDY